MSATEREWRVMRFENAAGQWAEVASNHLGPEQLPMPPGYRFVSATPMIAAEQLQGAVEENRILSRALSLALKDRVSDVSAAKDALIKRAGDELSRGHDEQRGSR